MEDIRVLSEQILTRIKQEGQTKLEDYQKDADERITGITQKLLEIEKKEKELITAQMNHEFERQKQTLKNEQRNEILAKKQTLLNSIFDQAISELENWDEASFANFLTGVLNQLDKNKGWTLVPGELSKDIIQSNQVAEVLAQNSFVTVSDQILKNKAGFIMQQGGIDYNFCFDVLINELKKDFSPQLAMLAF